MFLSAEGMQISEESQLRSFHGTTTPLSTIDIFAGLLSYAALFLLAVALVRGITDCGFCAHLGVEHTAIVFTIVTSLSMVSIVHAAMHGTAIQMLIRGAAVSFILGALLTVAIS